LKGKISLPARINVEIISAETEVLLVLAAASGIELTQVEKKKELTISAYLAKKDYAKLDEICKKRGASIRILKKTGFYWYAIPILRRPVLLLGMLILLIVVYWLPSRVLFVQVDGNNRIPANRILSAAEECGIRFGASRRDVRSEKMKNALLSAVSGLQWAGVNTRGCTAIISVRERETSAIHIDEKTVTNMVAVCDGYILDGTVTSGNGLFQPGQTVKRGQILISGYTDCGTYIRGSRASGEINAQTRKNLDAFFMRSYFRKDRANKKKYKISLRFRKKRINLWKDSGISDSTCDRIYKEYYIPLPGGFCLPAALCVEEFIHYDTILERYSPEQAEAELQSFAKQYILSQMVAGQILQKEESVTLSDGVYHLTGKYICMEMICREQRVQIGDTNGKTD